MFKSFISIAKKSLASHTIEAEVAPLSFEKFTVELKENMRALQLIANVVDQLLSRGMAASDVVYHALGIANTYCSRKVHVDISHTLLTLSLDRGIDREPLTIVQTITLRGPDYFIIEQVESLARQIRSNTLTIDEAEIKFDEILRQPRLYGRWVTHFAAGVLSTGVVMLFSHKPIMWLIAFMMGFCVNILLYKLARSGMPAFFSQIFAGLAITMVAVVVSYASHIGNIDALATINPTLLVISGIVLLVAGMMVVAAFQDAIDEYYVTAAARLLKVLMMTGGIVIGVTIGLYLASKLGVHLTTTPDRLQLSSVNFQYVGAALLAAAFALGNRSRLAGVVGAGIVGCGALYITLLLRDAGVGAIPASGVAAAGVGLAATILLRAFHISTIVTITAGIIPLVPGLTLYSGLMYIAQSTPDTATFNLGVDLVVRAILIAIVVATGAAFGNLIGRPAQSRHIHHYNRLPFRGLRLRRLIGKTAAHQHSYLAEKSTR
jgi:uncharacterized membrane protein YjjP (DUF1212 family)